ncbi:MAG TPA: TonB-dependent receptor [Paludibacter sp.]|nr:TonB-dependent receptor [Paludibacter sp.]
MRKITYKILLFSALIINSIILPAANPTDTIKHRNIKEIVVYGLKANSVVLPAVEITKQSIEKLSAFTPADAMQHATGISLSRDGIWATSVNVRGFSEQRLLILTDDDRLLTATDISAALSTVDMNSVEKIEVIKGAASVIYGSGAMGGVVNFITERPQYTQIPQYKGSITSGYNTVNNLWANSANVKFTNSDWYLKVNGSYRTAQNTMTPNGLLKNSQFNDASWGINGGKKFGDNQEFLVNYNHFEAWNVGLPGGSAFPSTAVVRYLGVNRNQLSGEYIFTELNDIIKKLSIKAYTQNITRDVENQVNATTRILPSSLNQTSGAKAIMDLYFNDYNTMKVGAESWIRKQKTSRIKMIYPSDTTYIAEQPTPNASMFDAGVFAQYRWVISPKYFTLNSGVRLDFIRTENDTSFLEVFKYKLITGNRLYLPANRKVLFYPTTSYNISYSAHIDLEYTPLKQHRFVLSLANAYRAASIEERYKYIDQAGTLRVGNPGLKPEKGFFSNFNYSFSKNNIQVDVDLFANYLFDLITEKSEIYGSGGVNSVRLVNANVDKALFTGAEVELKWILTKQFWLLTNASYTRARDINANTFLPQIPPLHGEFTLNYRVEKMFEAALSVLGAARQAEVAPTENATDGHVILNFNVHSFPFNLKKTYLQLFAGADNILNTAYYNHLSTTRGINRLEPGRNIYVKVKWGW